MERHAANRIRSLDTQVAAATGKAMRTAAREMPPAHDTKSVQIAARIIDDCRFCFRAALNSSSELNSKVFSSVDIDEWSESFAISNGLALEHGSLLLAEVRPVDKERRDSMNPGYHQEIAIFAETWNKRKSVRAREDERVHGLSGPGWTHQMRQTIILCSCHVAECSSRWLD